MAYPYRYAVSWDDQDIKFTARVFEDVHGCRAHMSGLVDDSRAEATIHLIDGRFSLEVGDVHMDMPDQWEALRRAAAAIADELAPAVTRRAERASGLQGLIDAIRELAGDPVDVDEDGDGDDDSD